VEEESLVVRWEEWLTPEVRQIAEGAPLDRVRLLDAVRRLLPWPAAGALTDPASAQPTALTNRRLERG
jgi:ATP-dependent helicase HrpB